MVGLIFFLGLLILFMILAGIVPKPWAFRDANTAVDVLRQKEAAENGEKKPSPRGTFGLM